MKSKIEIRTNPGHGIRWTAFVFHKGWREVGTGVQPYHHMADLAASKAIDAFTPPTYNVY